MKQVFLGILLLALAAASNAGQLFKCVGKDGVSAYQETPCSKGAKQAYQRYVAPVPNSRPSSMRSRSTVRAVPQESGQAIGYGYQAQPSISNYQREEAARRAQNAQAFQGREQRGRDRSRADPLHRIETEPTRLQDYQGNQYLKPPGSTFATDEKTGKQCFVNGAFIHC